MSDVKNRTVNLLQVLLLIINISAIYFLVIFVYVTTESIRRHYVARKFLDNVQSIPTNPQRSMIIVLVMGTVLVVTFLYRHYKKTIENKKLIASLVVDFMVAAVIMVELDFNYKGLLLLICANIITYLAGNKTKFIMAACTVSGYLLADYELISIYMPLYRISEYIQYYTADVQQLLYSVVNLLNSLNIIVFIIYCVYVMNAQSGTIDEINKLNHELQSANGQLKEYAEMTERMTQTRERNRLAREIHDTLGHTLTGIATGLDAAMALMDVSPEQTRKQLELLSKVSRDGIKDVRRSVNELRPDALERLSLEVAVRQMITEMAQVSSVDIYFETEEKNMRFDEDEENAIYRVIQESITNAVRHGKAKKIWITIERKDGELILEIKDNGIGCDNIKSGFGTKHIRERIDMLKGHVEFDGSKGFTVTAYIPIRWGENYD